MYAKPRRSLALAVLKLTGYLIALAAAGLLLAPLLHASLSALLDLGREVPDLDLKRVLVEGVSLLGAVLAASAYGLWVVEPRPWRSLGLRWHPRAALEIALGVGLAAGLLALVWVVDGLWSLGVQAQPWSWPTAQLDVQRWPAVLLLMLLVAVNEELMVRGVPLQLLIRYLGPCAGVVVTSLIFGLLHITGDAWNAAVVALDTGFTGALLALAYLRTRALWMPIGLHFGNNFLLFVLENPSLEQLNFIPPEISQSAFWGWWLVNFPAYVLALFWLLRWRYRADPQLEALYQRHVAPLADTWQAEQTTDAGP
ncbi:MAG TPA: CPBP family intramembrane glutamic endopeptidase [Candidatus Bipolaricaulota bacterium]